ncbi:hypothetical protein O181_048876 [Austropuccinia psidii MF-1]|uniref:CCHC-type domain-containing protein n=1 Tax=Austropuccinia psidii MF-1 TaxID=1389203 RepID=A0A9Q3DRF6_9BASI|nr:hypothetical protein [Austropuccinia psidii MF-1]
MLLANHSNTPKSNTSIVLLLRRTFAMFKKLSIKADKLKGLLEQVKCCAPPTLDQTAFNQLITAAILSKGDDKPSSVFIGQVIINASQQGDKKAQELSPFIYRLSDPSEPPVSYVRPHSPYNPQPLPLLSEVSQPSNHLVDKFGTSCFHCGRAGHWHADCPHTKGVANPNLEPPSPTPFRPMLPTGIGVTLPFAGCDLAVPSLALRTDNAKEFTSASLVLSLSKLDQVLFGQTPSISTLYLFGAEAIVHVPAVWQSHKLLPRGLACRLLKPLISGGWLLWDPVGDRQVQSASVVFPRFQSSNNTPTGSVKGSLSHIVNAAMLGQVPTEWYFKNELKAIDTLPVTKDVVIPEHLGQALSGPLQHKWKRACKAELEQMTLRDVWEAVDKGKMMKMIGHRWVFNIKHHADGTIEKFKACFVAQADCQRPRVDCTKTYAPTAFLMSLRLVLADAMCRNWTLSSFDISGTYLYSPVKETVFIEPPTFFCPQLKGKVL